MFIGTNQEKSLSNNTIYWTWSKICSSEESKHQLDPKIGTENPKGPESEGTDGGDTSINVPGDNVGTDVIFPWEGASDDKSDEPPVLPSNPPPNGKILM